MTLDKYALKAAAEAATCCDQDSNYRYTLERNSFIPLSLRRFVDAARPRVILDSEEEALFKEDWRR